VASPNADALIRAANPIELLQAAVIAVHIADRC
jgi:hypothetical protein